MSSDAAQDLHDHYTTAAGRIQHHAEQWLRQLVNELLRSYSLTDLKHAVTTALHDLPKHRRHTLRLTQILRPEALRCYLTKPAAPTATATIDAASRVYLTVPFDDKDAAKAAGAKWDPDRKRWYAPRDDAAALQRLEQWTSTTPRNQQNHKDPKRAARSAAKEQATREGHAPGTREHEQREQQLYEIWLLTQQSR